ncbi:hypothetical protein [Chitiniphilus shinanonensis]|uniref:hypothetical protein n=1 Tax=Chitiniphilus shinanonensis TaxID=553088 RepID=UPI001B7FC293|nr:hypothetical protein [Chitiniphilus shinanonensis]
MDYLEYADFHVRPRQPACGLDQAGHDDFSEPWPLASRYPADMVESDGGEA